MADTLNVSKRSTTGKGTVKRLRAEGIIPGVVYGKNKESYAVQIPEEALELYLSEHGRMVDLSYEGQTIKTLVKEVQHDIFSDKIMHIDFQLVSMTEKISLPIPVTLTGELTFPPDQGALEQSLTEVDELLVRDRFLQV